jgi:LacI family transcriptional regulator
MSPDIAVSAIRELLPDRIPLVLLNSLADGHSAITIDNYGGANAMMRHLAELGHTRVGFIKGPEQNADAAERLRGYRHAIRQMGGARDAEIEFSGDFSEQSGYAAALTVAAMDAPPTAIFAANDAMAVGALSGLAGRGLAVPGDIAVVGFDDIPIARYLAPPLTTVKVDIAELGRRAFEIVFESIDRGAPAPPHNECIPTSLVVRQSCGAMIAGRRARKTRARKPVK